MTGDTVLYDGVRQVADSLQVDTALLHLGCVRFPVTGPVRYSMPLGRPSSCAGWSAPGPPSPSTTKAGAISTRTDPPSRVSSRRRQPTSAAASAGYLSGRRPPSPRDHQPEESSSLCHPTQDRKVEARPAVLPWPGWSFPLP